MIFHEVDTQTLTAAGDLGGIHAVTAEAVHSGLADGVGGQLGNESGIHAVVSQGNSDVGLAAAEGGLKRGSLNETLVVEGLQTQHQFAEGNNSCHSDICRIELD